LSVEIVFEKELWQCRTRDWSVQNYNGAAVNWLSVRP